MRISEFIKKLEGIKQRDGDLEVLIDLRSVIDDGDHGEYSHEEAIKMTVERIGQYDADRGVITDETRYVLSLGIDL
jgi:hypothetical protein